MRSDSAAANAKVKAKAKAKASSNNSPTPSEPDAESGTDGGTGAKHERRSRNDDIVEKQLSPPLGPSLLRCAL